MRHIITLQIYYNIRIHIYIYTHTHTKREREKEELVSDKYHVLYQLLVAPETR